MVILLFLLKAFTYMCVYCCIEVWYVRMVCVCCTCVWCVYVFVWYVCMVCGCYIYVCGVRMCVYVFVCMWCVCVSVSICMCCICVWRVCGICTYRHITAGGHCLVPFLEHPLALSFEAVSLIEPLGHEFL